MIGNTIPFKDIKDWLLADPETKAEYDRLGPEFKKAEAVAKATRKKAARSSSK